MNMRDWWSISRRALRYATGCTVVATPFYWAGSGGRFAPWRDHPRGVIEVLQQIPIMFVVFFVLFGVWIAAGKSGEVKR
jgi:hypothetical protein